MNPKLMSHCQLKTIAQGIIFHTKTATLPGGLKRLQAKLRYLKCLPADHNVPFPSSKLVHTRGAKVEVQLVKFHAKRTVHGTLPP